MKGTSKLFLKNLFIYANHLFFKVEHGCNAEELEKGARRLLNYNAN